MNLIQINSAEKKRILRLEEGHFLDFKAKEIAPSKLTKSIVSFANADGGELFVGIAEKGDGEFKWDGFAKQEDANAHIQTFDSIFPLGDGYRYTFLQISTLRSRSYILHIVVDKSATLRTTADGTVYRRRGAQNLSVTKPEEIERLRASKGIISYESAPVAVPCEAVLNSHIMEYFKTNIIPKTEPRTWLEKQFLLRDGKLSVAGLLLFSDEPQAALPKHCGLKLFRYKTREKAGTRPTLDFDPVAIDGPIYEQIRKGVELVRQTLTKINILTSKGIGTVQYPTETLHEVLTNALIHRDYQIAKDVHIRIFDDRIEIESPGRLPGHVTPQNILAEQFARNGAIVRLLAKFPEAPNKDIGEGLNTAFDAMRNIGLKPPEIQQTETSVIVHIRHSPLASPEDTVLEYLQTYHEINNAKGREICHLGSENGMKRVFERLMKRHLIERIPGRKGNKIAYRLRR